MSLRQEMQDLIGHEIEKKIYKLVYCEMKKNNEKMDWLNPIFANAYRYQCARFYTNAQMCDIKNYSDKDIDLNDTHKHLIRDINYTKREYSKDDACRKCSQYTVMRFQVISRSLDEGFSYLYKCDNPACNKEWKDN